MGDGETGDRIAEGDCRMAGLNLLAVVMIYLNIARLGELVASFTASGNSLDPALLPHVFTLDWEHLLTGEYR